MASGGDLNAAFGKFAKNNQLDCKSMTKWATDAGVLSKKGACTSNNLDIAFSGNLAKCGLKGKKAITTKELPSLLDALADSYGKDKKMDKAAARADLEAKLAAAAPQAHGTTKTSKTGGVDKMTDASQYTGSHKERFNKDGTGKGIDGREDRSENTGYVGAYKEAGTYDKKH